MLRVSYLCPGDVLAACSHAGCEYAAVERVNKEAVLPILKELVRMPFFRYWISHHSSHVFGSLTRACLRPAVAMPLPCAATCLCVSEPLHDVVTMHSRMSEGHLPMKDVVGMPQVFQGQSIL